MDDPLIDRDDAATPLSPEEQEGLAPPPLGTEVPHPVRPHPASHLLLWPFHGQRRPCFPTVDDTIGTLHGIDR